MATNIGYSKKWIYLPLYFIFLIGSIWLLYRYLNPSDAPKELEPILVEEEKVPSDFILCFNENKHAIGGVVSLVPTDRLTKTFESLNHDCYDKICGNLTDLKLGRMSAKEFYKNVSLQDECLSPVFGYAQTYHWQMLEKLPMLGLFFNSGTEDISSRQRRDLGNFLEDYGTIKDVYGLLIIGRASALGSSEMNKNLSRLRSQSIIEFVDKHYRDKIETEFVYFGSDPPQLSKIMADRLGIDKKAYANINFGLGNDSDYSLRLNQSVLLVVYEIDQDPFQRISSF